MGRLLAYLLSLIINQRKIMSELTDLQAAVAANTVAIDAAAAVSAADKATIADLRVQLAAAQADATDGAALAAMAAQLTADDAKLPTAAG